MFKIILKIFFLFTIFVSGCSKENSPVSGRTELLVYSRDGVLESFGGDCSAVQIRTSSLGNLDLTGIQKVKFTLNGFSDADLSSIMIYYLDNNGEQVNLINLPHRDQINSTSIIEIDSPDYSGEIYLRLTLKSSVCTGQLFHIELRDLKIYTIN
ncbi:MAG: hypothetical protein IPH77_08870 [Ignavibacteria bacterium]|nr:hypothetical protein [Ignavibacteria bacterium]